MAVRFGPIQPIEWPQDKLAIPDGRGALSDIELVNRKSVKREFFCLTATVSNWSYGEVQETLITAPEDGDFWIAGMSMACFTTSGGPANVVTTSTTFRVNLVDVLSGYQFFDPFCMFSFLRNGDSFPSLNWSSVMPILSIRQRLMEPYCVMRNGALRLNISSLAKAVARDPHTIFFVLDGWKEYQYAAV